MKDDDAAAAARIIILAHSRQILIIDFVATFPIIFPHKIARAHF